VDGVLQVLTFRLERFTLLVSLEGSDWPGQAG
jgi:hypothetical protein